MSLYVYITLHYMTPRYITLHYRTVHSYTHCRTHTRMHAHAHACDVHVCKAGLPRGSNLIPPAQEKHRNQSSTVGLGHTAKGFRSCFQASWWFKCWVQGAGRSVQGTTATVLVPHDRELLVCRGWVCVVPADAVSLKDTTAATGIRPPDERQHRFPPLLLPLGPELRQDLHHSP